MRDCYRSIVVQVTTTSDDDMLLFGMLPLINHWEEHIKYDGPDNLANLLLEIGIFKTTSEARRNGYNKPIPIGYTEIKFKHYRNVYILNIPKGYKFPSEI